MGSVYYVDFENVHYDGLKGIEKLDSKDQVLIYCRENDLEHIKREIHKTKAKVCCRIVNGVSKNALDFELLTDLFMSKFDGVKYVISNDKGFDAAVNRGMRNNNLIFRKKSIKSTSFETRFSYYGDGCKEVVIC